MDESQVFVIQQMICLRIDADHVDDLAGAINNAFVAIISANQHFPVMVQVRYSAGFGMAFAILRAEKNRAQFGISMQHAKGTMGEDQHGLPAGYFAQAVAAGIAVAIGYSDFGLLSVGVAAAVLRWYQARCI